MHLTHSQYTQNERKSPHVCDTDAPGKALTKMGTKPKTMAALSSKRKIAVLVYLNGEISYSIVSIFLFSSNLCSVTHLEQIEYTCFHSLRIPLMKNSDLRVKSLLQKC